MRLRIVRRLMIAAAVTAIAATFVGAGRPAGADDLRHQRDQIQRKRAQLKVQIDLAVASQSRVEAEAKRLAGEVILQQRALESARQSLSAATSSVNDAQRRLDAIDAQSGRAHAALVARAVELYEHPFQSETAALTNIGSINDYANRQALISAIQGNTSQALDAFRQQHLDELAASHQLFLAQQAANSRRQLLQAQQENLLAAQTAAGKADGELRARIKDLQFENQGLAAQEASLEAQLGATSAQVAAAFVSSLPPGAHSSLIWPVHGPVTREFGYQAGGFHPGIDIAPPFGTPIHASGNGVVIYAGWESGYGNYTCINHGGGVATCYAHQSLISVSVGQTVSQGQVIGNEGSTGNSTGPHVHFEVRVNNVPNNPRNFVGGNP